VASNVPSTPLHDSSSTLYFVSDIHLGGSPEPQETVKRNRFEALLDRVEAEGASLYILGDLFDFWFGYRTVIPRTAFPILARLQGMARAGTSIRFLGGNHDVWISEFLAGETDLEVIPDGVLLEAQGRQARLFHGDGLGSGDRGYKLLKRVSRHPLAIRLFRWLHPDLGIHLALRSSHVSRGHTSERGVDPERLFREVALPELQDPVDAVLMGHHHIDVHLRREAGEFLILGDWFSRFTCVRLHDGAFTLLTWPLDDSE